MTLENDDNTKLLVDRAEFCEVASAQQVGDTKTEVVLLTVSRIDRVREPLTDVERQAAEVGTSSDGKDRPTYYDQMVFSHDDAHKLMFGVMEVLAGQGCPIAKRLLAVAETIATEGVVHDSDGFGEPEGEDSPGEEEDPTEED